MKHYIESLQENSNSTSRFLATLTAITVGKYKKSWNFSKENKCVETVSGNIPKHYKNILNYEKPTVKKISSFT